MVTCTVTDDKIVVWVDASNTDVVGWYYHIPVTSAMDDVVVREGDSCKTWFHETGAVRGLLCRKCNLGIGHMEDDYWLVSKAADYLLDADSLVIE